MSLSLKKSTYIALLISFSLITYFIESMLPPLIPAVAGARLGLSNIFILYALYAFGWKEAIIVAATKSLLGPIFAGYPIGIFFSLVASIFSLLTMTLLKINIKNKIGLIGISVAGSLLHNLGQVLVAMIFTASFSTLLILPLLAFISVPCGIITGVIADRLLKITSRISLKNKKLITRRKS